ncbi:hypothetical protein B0T24DRAFT_416599 [Lasiosphaeria ovina]|uniref:Uncharacterized protein n=1 Tax=Lasiosphaeria ovina TaxID=92902 RepID=A0AAE0JXQ0_9PEZI|nr:hypothetical protein B0T24DRAFT_416599 [Lasiosphaeria ovina]
MPKELPAPRTNAEAKTPTTWIRPQLSGIKTEDQSTALGSISHIPAQTPLIKSEDHEDQTPTLASIPYDTNETHLIKTENQHDQAGVPIAVYLGHLKSKIETLSRTARPDSRGMSTAALEVVEILAFARKSFKKGRGETAVETEHSPVDALEGKVLIHRSAVGALREVRFKTPKKDSVSVEIYHFTTREWAKACFYYRVLKIAHPSGWQKPAENLGQFALMKDERVIVWCHNAVVIEIRLLRPPGKIASHAPGLSCRFR